MSLLLPNSNYIVNINPTCLTSFSSFPIAVTFCEESKKKSNNEIQCCEQRAFKRYFMNMFILQPWHEDSKKNGNKMIVYLELKSDQSWCVCLWAFVDKHQSRMRKMRLLNDEWMWKKEKRILSTLTWVEILYGICCCLHLMSLYGSFVFMLFSFFWNSIVVHSFWGYIAVIIIIFIAV